MITFQNLLFGTVYVPCVLGDIKDYRVPNQWILAGWLIGLSYQIYIFHLKGFSLWFVSVLIPILILFPLYALKVLGAGDVKLLSVAFGIYGSSTGFSQLIYIGVLSGAGALFHLLIKKQLRSRFLWLGNYVREVYAGIVMGEGNLKNKVISSIKNQGAYYDKQRDGFEPAMHFTVFIGLGILLWEVVGL